MINTKNLNWTDLSNIADVPKSTLNWLIDNDSLSAKLKQKFDDFTVNVLLQKQAKPHANEIDTLDFTGCSVVREVALLGNGRAVVFARSVIPMTKDTEALLKIGSQPLGEILFNDNNIQRGLLQITFSDGIWGRRSTFTIGTTKVLVSEFFLAALYVC